jgi:hypothetical protein
MLCIHAVAFDFCNVYSFGVNQMSFQVVYKRVPNWFLLFALKFLLTPDMSLLYRDILSVCSSVLEALLITLVHLSGNLPQP